MKLGWVGLGNMGVPISMNLLKAGYDVTVFNRTASKTTELVAAGAVQAKTLEELIQENDVIFTMVSDDEAVKDLYFSNKLLETAKPGQVFIDMSTVSPATSKELYAAAKDKGIGFIDAPVSGSVAPAKEGKLLVLAGGEEETYNKVKNLFEPIGKMSIYLGESGSGSNAKLAINLLLGITVQGIAESVLFAEQQGIKLEDMLTIINESAVGTAISKMKTPAILEDEYPAAFALKHMAKDLRLAKETGELNAIGNSAHHTYQDALANQLGDLDVMAVINELRSKQ
ncbi:NAD(P)-dependent oxidoreductase [Niallia circulans]|uniref:NAD(P)-dependent oxidoreductase n=1 Tax=Niallia circulans TaxID=1397 RepID=A0A553SPZ7_NIACI|nr:NAD(P)-dependent oxidoreductase [Niallia circulans]TRZ39073.1 NAD(P)-dependent oxidoreductase [Niallia circulans]